MQDGMSQPCRVFSSIAPWTGVNLARDAANATCGASGSSRFDVRLTFNGRNEESLISTRILPPKVVFLHHDVKRATQHSATVM